MTARQGLGRRGEDLAARYLAERGWQVIERNVRLAPWGEIDLVVRRAGLLALVEVRTRRGERYGPPLASLTSAKLARMRRAASAYLARLAETSVDAEVRIDVIGIRLDTAGRLVAIDHIENAVEA